MLRMSSEREKIQQIRSAVDQYDRYQQLYGGEAVNPATPPDSMEPRVVLCSQVGPCVTAGGYGIILSEDHGIKDFVTCLHDLFQGRMHSNLKFGQVTNWTCHYFCLYLTHLVGQDVLCMQGLSSLPGDW